MILIQWIVNLLNNFGNYINSLKDSTFQEATPVRPGDDMYQILKGGKYTGYGKALLPPHPEDLYPESDCCYTFPCITKPPCKHLLGGYQNNQLGNQGFLQNPNSNYLGKMENGKSVEINEICKIF